MGAVANIYAQLGDVYGRAAEGRRQLLGQTIANLSAIPGQVQKQYDTTRRLDAQTALEQARELRLRGQEDRAAALEQQAAADLQAKKEIIAATWADPTKPNVERGIQKAQELGQQHLIPWLQETAKKTAPNLVPVKTRDALGRETTVMQPEAPGLTTGDMAPEPPKAGELADYVQGQRAALKAAGKTEGPSDLLTWTRDYETAKRGPEALPSKQTKSVLLDGQPAEVIFNPKTGRFEDAGGTDVSARVKPMPPAALFMGNQPMPELPPWATDASRPTGAEANRVDPKLGLTPNGLFQSTMTWIDTGQFPPTGRGNDPRAVMMRTAVQNKAGAIAAEAGMDVPTFRAFYKANAGSLNQQQKFYDAAQSFLATADKNAALLQGTLAKIPDTGIPLFNQPLRAFSKSVLGNPDLSQFATYLMSVQNEYAKLLNNPNLSGQLTDSARKETQDLIDGKATVAQMLGSLQALNAEGNNRLVSIGEQIQRIQGRMQGGQQPAPAGPKPTHRFNPATGKLEPIS